MHHSRPSHCHPSFRFKVRPIWDPSPADVCHFTRSSLCLQICKKGAECLLPGVIQTTKWDRSAEWGVQDVACSQPSATAGFTNDAHNCENHHSPCCWMCSTLLSLLGRYKRQIRSRTAQQQEHTHRSLVASHAISQPLNKLINLPSSCFSHLQIPTTVMHL